MTTNDKKKFLEELMNKCKFKKEEFYSNYENNKIKLLCYLNEKEIFKKQKKEEKENYFSDSINTLDEKRVSLIHEINDKIIKLKNIKDSLSKFHKITYLKFIQTIANIINEIEIKSINDYIKLGETIQGIFKHEILCGEINEVKDFLLFKIIFNNTQDENQEKRFEIGIEKLKGMKESFRNGLDINKIFSKDKDLINVLDKIKDILSKKEEKEL